ncbi:hypothetical protein [Aeromicrobium flavum]|uniref:hypothetical protein n=1 Tax=Aeromicrobium flavum TaxID=416568 RepID=UPI0031CF2205
MDATKDDASDEVTMFLDGGDLYVTGDRAAIDVVLTELLGPGDSGRRRSETRLAEGGAVAASILGGSMLSEELLRLTPEALEKLEKYNAQGTGNVLRGYVRNDRGHFAGDLSFEKVTFGAEQALTIQTAAVALALRSAIADVQAAVEAVDQKVSDIQRKVRAREVGEVVGTYRFLHQIVDSTRARGRLLEADWDQVSGARRDLEIALESLRAYARESIESIDAADSLPKREEAIEQLGSNKAVAGSLRLILVAEQALHLAEYLRLERVRSTDPDQVESVLGEARHSIALHRERDADLVRAGVARVEAAKRIDPLEIHRIFSIAQLEKASTHAFDALEEFATASRANLPEFDRSVQRPALAETRAEVKRQAISAKDGVVDVSRTAGKGASIGAKQASSAIRQKVRRKTDQEAVSEQE